MFKLIEIIYRKFLLLSQSALAALNNNQQEFLLNGLECGAVSDITF